MARGVQGLEKLRAKLRALPAETKRQLREALDHNADELVAMQKRLAPRGPTGNLIRSIQKRDGEHELQIKVGAGGPLTTKPVRNGATVEFDYSGAVEFGTSDTAAKPFFFPSYRALRRRMRGRTSRATSKAAKAVAKGGK
ncbi:HK97-gp10 family putative phage morphogenesis protein [Rhodoligotrophos ferricapiens]|uniref:HK97-gp10 family putative phage morphogenesis protein n=1 Tax=Rhodoligotrophos ferricapiens TaxID=3069264 RepID=UPI00315C977D